MKSAIVLIVLFASAANGALNATQKQILIVTTRPQRPQITHTQHTAHTAHGAQHSAHTAHGAQHSVHSTYSTERVAWVWG